MESFVADLKTDMQCSLCNDTLIEPKILPCFDIFCKLCIKRHAELIDEVNVFECPQCQSQTSLPEPSSLEDLQPSLLHSRILKGLALVEGEKVCSVSESHSSVSWYCFDCDHSLCQECEKSHSFFIKDHKVVLLADLNKEDIELIITRESPCKSHPHHRLELFCEDCKDMVCLTCWKHDHQDHKTMSLDKFASMKKAVLSKHLQVLEQFGFGDKQQEKIANTIKQQEEQAQKEVKDKTKKIIEMLRENERNLLKQIDEMVNRAKKNLNIIHHTPAIKKYIKNVMERGLASEMMNIDEEPCSENFIFEHIPPSFRVELVPNEQLVQEINSRWGEIRSWPKTDHTKSTINEIRFAVALSKKKLILMTKTSTGELNHDPMDVFDVHIKPEENVNIEKKCVGNDGKVEVEFVPKVPGQLTAEVRVNGNHVSNSPQVIDVRPQEPTKTGKFFMDAGARIFESCLKGVAVNRDNSRVAVANWSSSCVHVFLVAEQDRRGTDGSLLLTYGSQGSAQGQLSGPEGLAFLNNTDLVIADNGNQRMCIVDTTSGSMVRTFGNQGSRDGEFRNPCGVRVADNSTIIVCDAGNHRVQVFTSDGVYQYQFGLTTQDKFDPIDVITHDGLFYVSDVNNHVIHVFEKKGNVPTRISTIGGKGSTDGQLNIPWGLAIGNDHHLLVCDHGNKRVQKFTLDGRFVGKSQLYEIKELTYSTMLNDVLLLVCTGYLGPHHQRCLRMLGCW